MPEILIKTFNTKRAEHILEQRLPIVKAELRAIEEAKRVLPETRLTITI